MELIGRARERSSLAGVLDSAADGFGGAVAIVGAPGSGRSALLAHVRDRARERGFDVLSASAAPFERGHPLGVARRLLLPRLLTAAEAERDELRSGPSALACRLLLDSDTGAEPLDTAADLRATSRSLFWLCWRLAQRAPLAVLVDDLESADEVTAAFVEHLAATVADSPIAVVVTRPCDGGGAEAFTVLRLGPLGDDEASALLERHAPGLMSEAVDIARHAAGGNAGFLVDLAQRIDEARDQSGAAPSVERIRELARDRIADRVAVKLDELEPDARLVAFTTAVLGADAAVSVADVSELDPPAYRTAAAQLDATELFGAPWGREREALLAVLYELIPPALRDDLHARAARALLAVGEAAGAGAHLLRTQPSARPWVVDALVDAARLAMNAGALDAASELLARALAEPPDAARRAVVLTRLGHAERRAQRPGAAARFREVSATSADPAERIEANLELAWTMYGRGKIVDALDEIDRLEQVEQSAIAAIPGCETKIAAAYATIARTRPDTMERARRRLAPMMTSPPAPTGAHERALLAEIAYQRAMAVDHRDVVAELCLAAMGGPQLTHLDTIPVAPRYLAVLVLAWCEEFDVAERAAELIRERGLAKGDTMAVVIGHDIAAKIENERGRLVEAIAHCDTALRASREGIAILLPGLLARRAIAQVETGDVGGAQATLGRLPDPDRWRTATSYHGYLLAQAVVAAARNDHRRAFELGRRCGRELRVIDNRNPGSLRWRVVTARAAKVLGEPVATQLAAELRENAERFGAPGALGVARLLGAEVGPDTTRLVGLRDAVDALRRSEAALELARGLVELGAAERVAGQEADGDAHLLEGAAMAARLGATPLAELASAHLRAREVPESTSAPLEPAQQFVATLLARGMGTPEIADTLFLSVPAVEQLTSQAMRTMAATVASAARSDGVDADTEPHDRLRLQGRFEIHRDGVPVELAPAPARLVKFVALAGRAVPVDELIDQLWPEVDLDRGRERLRTLLARVRRVCGDLIERGVQTVELADGVVVDSVEFTRGVDRVLAADPDDRTTLRDAMAVAASYGGELLPSDRFEDWTEPARAGLRARYLRLLDLLAVLAERHATPEQAAGWFALGIEVDPYGEDRAVRAAELWVRHGRPRAALDVLDRAEERALEIELPLGPAAAALRERLRAERNTA